MTHSQTPTSGTFSIATPALNTIISISENMSDPTYMLPAATYQQGGMMEQTYCNNKGELRPNQNLTDSQKPQSCHELMQPQDLHESAGEQEVSTVESQTLEGNKQRDDQSLKSNKKRNKITKKSTKLDAKSKLEKSRQSARECRARKKLRYQYLEDLVCNREKAVIKLREELSMFCALSDQIDSGSISEADRRLLTDQTKENTGTS